MHLLTKPAIELDLSGREAAFVEVFAYQPDRSTPDAPDAEALVVAMAGHEPKATRLAPTRRVN